MGHSAGIARSEMGEKPRFPHPIVAIRFNLVVLLTLDFNNDTATRSGISTGREGLVAPVPEPVLPFRD